MKKIIALLLVVLLLTGCGNTATSGDTTTERETLRVGMECDYAPFNWTQEATTTVDGKSPVEIKGGNAGYCWGYDVLIAQEIADTLDMDLEINKIEWSGLPIAANNNEIDLIIAGMTDNEERRESLDFTTPYYESEMVLIVRKDSEYVNATSIQDFNGATVVAQLNTFHDDLIDQISGVTHATPLDTFPLMTVALQSSVVDAMVSELPVAMAITSSNEDLTYVEFTEGNGFETGADTTVSIAMSKENALFDSVQAALDQITAEQRTELMQFALANQPE